MRFFRSSLICAKVSSQPSGRNKGSYPKPPLPTGSRSTRPGHSPRAVRTSPLLKQSVMTLTKRACRCPSGTSFISSRSFWLLDSSVASSPENLAEYTPGAPSSTWTSSPESSAMALIPVAFMMASALIREFSSKVVPVSSTSRSAAPASAFEMTCIPKASVIFFISLSLCAFPVAATTVKPFKSKGTSSCLKGACPSSGRLPEIRLDRLNN